MIRQTEQIAELAAALAQAQAELENVAKDALNPHFSSRYADLASVLDEVRPKLARHGIAIVQIPINGIEGQVGVTTRLMHASGQYIEGDFYIAPSKYDAQGAGSALTYLRRYSLMAVTGIGPEDDDGEAAVGRETARPAAPKAPARPASPATSESAAATAARQRVRMLINRYQQRMLTAPHSHALENVATDNAADLEEIERSGTSGAAAAKELRRIYDVKMKEFEEAGG
jgi:ERF superfamily